MTPVDLIIPDAGPLISLAHAGRLDLVEVFNRPIAVIDIVKLECLKKPTSPDHALLKTWFDHKSNAIRIINTPLRDAYDQALDDESTGKNARATRGMGDAAFGWLMPNLDIVARPGTVPLVLTEDKNLSITLSDQKIAHVLSTRAWLTGLQNAGLIESAAQIVEQIGRHDRNLLSLQVDNPQAKNESNTDWLASVTSGANFGR